MDGFSLSLVLGAAGVAVAHTALGPDHYLPFVMLSRARNWSLRRTTLITAVCGLGHVLSSLLLGGVGLLLGASLGRLEQLESGRGSLAAWLLIAFGLAYGAWGSRKALRRSRGIEPHDHGGHVHLHSGGDRPHGHPGATRTAEGPGVTFWMLIVIFVLGPCEPLIPLAMLPASRGRWMLAAWVAVVFSVITISAMIGMVLLGTAGLKKLRLESLARWNHALAGGVITATGLAIVFLGL